MNEEQAKMMIGLLESIASDMREMRDELFRQGQAHRMDEYGQASVKVEHG